MIWVADQNGSCTFANKPWLDFTGRSLQQELGTGWIQGIHSDDLERSVKFIESMFSTNRSFQLEYRLRRADGEYRWVLSSGAPRLDRSGSLAGFVGGCIDVTDLKNAEQERLAHQKLETVGTLAGGIAHDFNNLLAGILANAELADSQVQDRCDPREELQKINTLAKRGGEIVRQLMAYAGLESAVEELVDVSHLIAEMLDLLKISISKRAEVHTQLGAQLPAVRANPAQLRQVVMNLVINASEAVVQRPGVIRITTSRSKAGAELVTQDPDAVVKGDYLVLEVSDSGCGMTADAQARIFDPFYTTKFAGRGLGLAVVQGIVRGLRGGIRVESEPGKGTTIQVLLPGAVKTN
jgi:PAS domain S-box-containing protein